MATMSRGLVVLAASFAALAIALVVLIVVSSLEMNIWAGLRAIVSSWWGITTLVDVYTGLIFVAVWIGVLERRPVPIVVWTIALLTLGNLATAAYLLNRARHADRVRDIFFPSPT